MRTLLSGIFAAALLGAVVDSVLGLGEAVAYPLMYGLMILFVIAWISEKLSRDR